MVRPSKKGMYRKRPLNEILVALLGDFGMQVCNRDERLNDTPVTFSIRWFCNPCGRPAWLSMILLYNLVIWAQFIALLLGGERLAMKWTLKMASRSIHQKWELMVGIVGTGSLLFKNFLPNIRMSINYQIIDWGSLWSCNAGNVLSFWFISVETLTSLWKSVELMDSSLATKKRWYFAKVQRYLLFGYLQKSLFLFMYKIKKSPKIDD